MSCRSESGAAHVHCSLIASFVWFQFAWDLLGNWFFSSPASCYFGKTKGTKYGAVAQAQGRISWAAPNRLCMAVRQICFPELLQSNHWVVSLLSYRTEIIIVQLLDLKIEIIESPIFIGPQAFNNLLMVYASSEDGELQFLCSRWSPSVCVSSSVLAWQPCSGTRSRTVPAGADLSLPGRTQLLPQGPAGKVWSVPCRRQGHIRDLDFLRRCDCLFCILQPHPRAGSSKVCDTKKSALSDARSLSSPKVLGFGVSKEGFEPPKAALTPWLFVLAWT